MELHYSYFFDIDSFEHKKLFEGTSYVWQALVNIDSYLSTYPLGKIEVLIPDGVTLVNKELITIGKGTIIEPCAYIKGPCIIGENCSIRHGAYMRGSVIVGNNVVIGHDTEVKHSLILNHAAAAHFAYVGDTIIGSGVNLGAGVKCANLRLDRESIHLIFENKKIETNLKKLGAIIGDNSQLGCNSVTNPGTLMGKESMCYPCTNFGGIIPSKTVIKPANRVIMKTK